MIKYNDLNSVLLEGTVSDVSQDDYDSTYFNVTSRRYRTLSEPDENGNMMDASHLLGKYVVRVVSMQRDLAYMLKDGQHIRVVGRLGYEDGLCIVAEYVEIKKASDDQI